MFCRRQPAGNAEAFGQSQFHQTPLLHPPNGAECEVDKIKVPQFAVDVAAAGVLDIGVKIVGDYQGFLARHRDLPAIFGNFAHRKRLTGPTPRFQALNVFGKILDFVAAGSPSR